MGLHKLVYLLPWEEINRVIQKVINGENRMIVSFREGTKLSLPSAPELIEILQEKGGKKIGILQTDLPSKPYLVREENEKVSYFKGHPSNNFECPLYRARRVRKDNPRFLTQI